MKLQKQYHFFQVFSLFQSLVQFISRLILNICVNASGYSNAILSFAYYSSSEYLQLVSRTVRGTYILLFARCLSIFIPTCRDTVLKLICAVTGYMIDSFRSIFYYFSIVKTFSKNNETPLAGIKLSIIAPCFQKDCYHCATTNIINNMTHKLYYKMKEFILFEHISYLFLPPERNCLRILLT